MYEIKLNYLFYIKKFEFMYSINFSEKQKMADIKAVKRALDEREKVSSELDVRIIPFDLPLLLVVVMFC